jgi:hypothetical protein
VSFLSLAIPGDGWSSPSPVYDKGEPFTIVRMVFCSKRVQSRLALYHSVRALYMPFSDDAEETFCKALAILQVLISLQLQHSLCLGQGLKCAGLSDDFSSDR